jgi:hypothetical protein|tara:strand:+ start:1959 stop:2468 length:510 start_codon:yes stop_codon:yes gene_type:complete
MKRILLAALILIGLQTQAQLTVCDSLSYSIFPNTTLTVTPSSGGIGNMVGAIDWNFTACNDVACYTAQGINPYSFPLINMTDTVKLCYDAFVYALDSTMTICNYCDSVVYDFNLFTWVVMLRNTPTSINELIVTKLNDGKIYDMLGRELSVIPYGEMYIRNQKLYIWKQ